MTFSLDALGARILDGGRLAAGIGVLESAPEPLIAFYSENVNACVRR